MIFHKIAILWKQNGKMANNPQNAAGRTLPRGAKPRSTPISRRWLLMAPAVCAAIPNNGFTQSDQHTAQSTRSQTPPSPSERLLLAARSQIGVTTSYDGGYTSIAYPGGDVDRATGVCIDVLIRAYRDAFSFDFQQHIHNDMDANFSAYPKIWGLTRTDKNIDHRRVPNIETYLTRHGAARPTPTTNQGWRPGDIVSMRLVEKGQSGGLPHIAIISDRRAASGRPYVIHNIGSGAREDDIIGQYAQERRFRFFPDDATQ